MASLKDATQLTENLENLVSELRSELENGDFDKLVSLADEISEGADGLAETFSTINQTLMERIEQVKDGGGEKSSGGRSKAKAAAGS